MHIKDHNDAMTFFRNSKQLESNGKWKEFVEESKFDDMLQEPRPMAQGGRIGLKPGGIVEPGVMYYGRDPEPYKLNPDQIVELKKKVKKFNKKHGLTRKGIRLATATTQAGNTTLRIQTNPAVWKDYFKELGISSGKSAAPTIDGFNELETIIKDVKKTDIFKTYDKSKVMKAGGVKSGLKQLENIGSKQAEIMKYLIDKPNANVATIAKDLKLDSNYKSELIKTLSVSAGHSGLAGGQYFDLTFENKNISQKDIINMQKKKTGELFGFCCESIAIIKGVKSIKRKKLKEIGINIGLLFQIVDDLIDYKGDSMIVGKPTRSDEKKGKATLVNLLGYEETINFAKNLKKKIDQKIKKYGTKANDLLDSVEFILKRKF